VTVGYVLNFLKGFVQVVAINVRTSFLAVSWSGQLVAYTGKRELTNVIRAFHVVELVDCFLNVGHNTQSDLFALRLYATVWHCVSHFVSEF
jgi:hypothetical protein